MTRLFVRPTSTLVSLAAISLLTLASSLRAQSAQKYGFQIAALATSIRAGGSGTNGFGVEPQLRFNQVLPTGTRGMISLGLGAQYTTHSGGGERFTISGVFLEPRWVPALKAASLDAEEPRFIPYVSARLGILRQSSNFASSSSGSAFGAGGGFAIRINDVVNLDAGLQIVRQTFGDVVITNGNTRASFIPFNTYAAKVGLSIGFPRE